MDTIMVQSKSKKLTFKLARCYWLGVFPLSVISTVNAAETRFEPLFETALYAYQIKPGLNGDKDNGGALELSPALVWYRNAANMQTNFNWRHSSVLYEEDERDNSSFDDIEFSNVFFAFDKRLSWDITARQNYVVRDTRQGIFSDKITGSDKLSKNQSYGSSLRYKNAESAKYRTEATLRFNESDSEAPEVESDFSDFGDFSTTNYALNWALGTNARALNFFWLYEGDVQEVERTSLSSYSARRHGVIVGLPIAPSISAVARAGSERANNQANFDNKYEYFGAGVEYRFGAISRINVTMNRSDSSVGDARTETDTYVASDFLFAPSRRTRIEGSLDRRYFGRTLTVQGNYNLRFLSISVSTSDSVTTQNLFDNELQNLGVFVCPTGSANFADCFKPPSNQYVPVFGESLQQISANNAELRQELVQAKRHNVVIAYSRSRLNLSLNVSEITTDYIEREDSNTNQNVSLQTSWILNDHNKLVSNLSYYDIDYQGENRKDKNISLEFGLNTKLSAKSEMSVTLRRLDRESTLEEFDNSENRIWLSFQHRF
ncbi:outer membrane beta-barrel protein [Alishewanella tabrizica]|uniref:TIGR03016 family PEP-CTERM system-associated outer membrane protein n=1 Tax=Alishewanella tabrizica TaxID=671278 RepID=A0ABQ2WQF8_9ALTE|nr:outer membrane beta-barrel protein [Alishewanella tabrizica]GGW62539.1 hypothetical protein GCM10008111_18130 [Alishewanella tabrizica]